MQQDNVSDTGASLDSGVCQSIEQLENYLKSDKTKNAKKFLRTARIGSGSPFRRRFWTEICKYHSKIPQSDSFYDNRAGNDGMASLKSLPKFIDPAFADDFWLQEEGISRLYRIINTVGISYTHVIYAPLLYPVTAVLLHFLPHQEAYKAVCSLMDNNRVHHLDQTPNMYSRTSMTFQKLSRKVSPKTYRWIENSLSTKEDEIVQFFLTWPLWIFRGLPLKYIIRVFDNFLLEGTRALYRSSLLILILYSQFGDGIANSSTPKFGIGNNFSPSRSMRTRRSFTERLRRSFRRSIRATPKVKRKFEMAPLLLDGLVAFVRNSLPSLLSEEEFIEKAYSIRGFSSRLLSKLASSLSIPAISNLASRLPLDISTSKEIVVKQITLNTLDVSVLYFVSEIQSSIANQFQLEQLWSHLPDRYTVVKPYIVFTSNEHGTSLRNFFHMVDAVEPLVILVKTSEADVFGAFCSVAWGSRKKGQKFFGTGETFVFSFGKSETLKVYKWVGYGAPCDTEISAGQQLFQCSVDGLDIGCGALHIPLDMNTGRSDRSSTFDNEPLASSRDFKVIAFEAIAFE
ncbi:GTPase-activating protein skywalker [Galendromus occidentalis]|uniref:GTPase-activating protein skywalker n=1 Tax=Galendromus occidentalis TaxID=34638 RepID=A0AAJ6VXY9_9ACAR|nr:GTPase-activating protein skywalker [Galendromus occidentalis]